ncbi:MAG: malto-oligosyltrehalose trehalohydrolase [Spirochaetaceae bacterium]
MSEAVSLWAPEAAGVDIVIGERRIPMRRGERGYWSVRVEEDLASVPYAFSVDGGPPRPDPRSERQPQGVHGPSLRVRHEVFEWSDAGFQQCPLSAAVIYELHVGTFTPEGTLDAAVGRLSHLTDLGVTHVELLPLAAASGKRGWGYDGVDLYAPHEAYGGPDAVKRFVDAAHGMGLAVLIDVVYNHLGPEGNYLGEFGPYFTDRYRTPWGTAVNLDGPGSDEVRRFFIDNALMWLRDYHADGLRIDAVHAFYDKSAVSFLEELEEAAEDLQRAEGRRLVVIAESDLNDPRIVRSREAGGYGLRAQWSDDFHHALHAYLTGERRGYYADFGPLRLVAKALERTFVFDGVYQGSRGRRHGRPAADLPADRFLGYIQNHDQVGNRALGERLSDLVGPELAKTAAAVYLLSPFVPMIFQGEEWAASSPFLYFTDHQDPDLGHAVREGRRSEFDFDAREIPDPQAPETAEASVLRWDERSYSPHAEVLSFYRNVLGIRHRFGELAAGVRCGMEVQIDEAADTLEFRRGRVRLLCNFSEETRAFASGDGTAWRILAVSAPERFERVRESATQEIRVPWRCAVVLQAY